METLELPLFNPTLREVQKNQEDYEWYPTTQEILDALIIQLRDDMDNNHWRRGNKFLDIGAGNGKVINAVRELNFCDYYAIEKSQTLLNLLPKDVFLLGVDFWNTSLSDKEVTYVFSNPPYSMFQEWTAKILREVPSETEVYLVIPERWETCREIQDVIKSRQQTVKIIGSFSFADAEDRKARANVHLLKVSVRKNRACPENDPFTNFFEETFKYPEPTEESQGSFEEKIEETKVVNRLNFIEALCRLYEMRMEELQKNYHNVCSLDASLLEEFNITKKGLIESLRMKIATAKKEYWQRLFDGMAEIKTRLTTKSRRKMLELMQAQCGIDFNKDNAYAIVLWVIKNANSYFDDQLVETYEELVDFANIENYASNHRVFTRDRFHYNYVYDKKESHFRLKVGHRLVLAHSGGLKPKRFNWDKGGLSSQAANCISDLLVVANNLGFQILDQGPSEDDWFDSEAKIFTFQGKNGKPESLFKIRTFQNSNMHVHFNPEFIHALNTQHGKLKGWVRDSREAAEELNIPEEITEKFFDSGFRLTTSALRINAA